jgi:hypothetical protein
MWVKVALNIFSFLHSKKRKTNGFKPVKAYSIIRLEQEINLMVQKPLNVVRSTDMNVPFTNQSAK